MQTLIQKSFSGRFQCQNVFKNTPLAQERLKLPTPHIDCNTTETEAHSRPQS